MMKLRRVSGPPLVALVALFAGTLMGLAKVTISDSSVRPYPLYVVSGPINHELEDSWTAELNVGSIDSIVVSEDSMTISGWVDSNITTVRVLGKLVEPLKTSTLTSVREDVAKAFDDRSLMFSGFTVTLTAREVDCIWFSGSEDSYLVYAGEDVLCE